MAATEIIIPCFNEEERLPGEALLSHLTDHPDLGFVLVNDGSTDATLPSTG